jgi:hypothetical protein
MENLEKRDSPEIPTEHTLEPSAIVIDHHAEAKLVRKLDFFIIPITMLLYLFSFLDRVNIGNARYAASHISYPPISSLPTGANIVN